MRRTKEDAEQTKERILYAAIGLFSSQGIEATTLDEIAKAADVTRGAIYWHFKNKADIFEALHTRLHEPLANMIAADLETDHPEPLQQLHDLCVKLFTDLETDALKKQSLSLFLFQCTYAGEFACYKAKHLADKQRSMKMFERYFERAQQKGKIPATADPALLTLSVHCYMKGLLFEYLNNPENFSVQKQGVALLDLYFGQMFSTGKNI